MGNNLEKLREITCGLPPFPEVIFNNPIEGYREYKMENEGNCFAWFIHRSGNDIAIHRWFNSKGTVFPEHTHKEKEWLIVYRGSAEIRKGDKTEILKAGDFAFNEPNIPHSAFFPEDCRYITIMIPPASEYPYEEAKSGIDLRGWKGL